MTEYIELTTVGEMLKQEFIEPFNLTQNALANAIFVPPNRIHQIIKGQRRITADTDLQEDLGADSLDVVDLLMSIEDEFEVEVPDEEIENIKTVGALVSYIEANS